ncbi:helix-turn-helix domain-containing protein [Streptomyces sp. CA-250714]|uniref:helix-turn-helix domain-containing protein n=1 Tax=Streptomyces sp. CA-250714 TaxID=3240060 RepID=UPI003D8CCC22
MTDAEVGSLAALLQELKDRTPFSYSALAKRLGVSPSTLHRYCRGTTVPADYAPIERFARLCKATPAELAEVHRRWAQAYAHRTSAVPTAPATRNPQEGPVSRPAPSPPAPGAAAVNGPGPVASVRGVAGRVAGLVIAAAALVLSALTPGAARAPSGPAQAAMETAPTTCLVNVATERRRCFSTFREAIAASTHGRITNAPVSARKAARDGRLIDRLREPTTAGGQEVRLGILYQGRNYGGNAWVITGSSICKTGNGRDHTLDLPGQENIGISSIVPVNCWVELFTGAHQTGPRQEYHQATPHIGDVMDDQAESAAFL